MLTKKALYAFQALSYLSDKHNREPVLISEISEQKKISKKFLEQILLKLKQGGILASKKGKGGGYFFAQEPDKVSLAKVMRLIDGPIAMLPCVSLNYYEKCENCDEKTCGLNRVMLQVRDANLEILENKTIQDIGKI